MPPDATAGSHRRNQDRHGGHRVDARTRRDSVEWPTIAVAAAIYIGFALTTWFHEALPWWAVVGLGAWLAAWQGSLQHEMVHGHPTRWRRVNHALAVPGFLLWLPFGLYRKTHMRHHVDSRLTDPLEDPESYYVTPRDWARMGTLRRGILRFHNTLAGRLLLGPPRAVVRLWSGELARLARGDRSHLRHWTLHLPAAALILIWVLWVCGLPLWQYVLGFVYGGTALTLLRSFLEHQAVEKVGERTVVVEAGPVMSLLYLNNNLHIAHHDRPALPWYRLPEAYRTRRAALLHRNGGYLYRGYFQIVLRYLFRAKERPVHPMMPGSQLASTARTANTSAPALPAGAQEAKS